MTLPSLQELKNELDALTSEMSRPDVLRNANRIKELARLQAQISDLLQAIERLTAIEAQKRETESLAQGGDEDISRLAEEELTNLQQEEQHLQERIQFLLVPPDPRDERDVILEIRSGAGGEEASLFMEELFRAYARYAENVGWHVHVMDHGKEIVAEISGQKVFGVLKFERGVHRVQRVPKTEKMGRIHTSTVTVAILPQVEEAEIEIRPEDLKTDTYRASGAGGQHVNKTSSAVRITHLPTNTVVAVQDERSQHKNREKAMKILRARLSEAQEEARAKKEAAERKTQIGTGDRSEKIRTYNFPQDRITDHRIKQSWSNIPGVMDGSFEAIFKDLQDANLKKSQTG